MRHGTLRIGQGFLWLVCVVGAMVAGCETVQKSNLTPGMVKKELAKPSTQADVLKLLGAPNIITRNAAGNEVWVYDQISCKTDSGAAGAGIGAAGPAGDWGMATGGGAGVRGQTSSVRTMTLMIEFGGDEKVKNYSMMQTEF